MSAAALQQVARRLGPAGIGAVLCGVGAAVVMILSASTLLSAARVPSATLVEQAEQERKASEDKFKAAFDDQLKQINGRSLFLVPGAPPPPAPARTVVPDEPKDPPKPSTYGGPALVGMINGVAWFNDGKKLAVGEGDSDLKMVELKPPWGAVVKWKDVEFTIGLFDRDAVVNPPPKPVGAASDEVIGPEAPPDAFPGEKPTPPKPPEPKPEPKPDPKQEPKPEPKPSEPRPSDTPAVPPPPPPPLEPPPQPGSPPPGEPPAAPPPESR